MPPGLDRMLNETVSALADAAYHANRENLRMQASEMLDVLIPEFRHLNPTLAAELEEKKQTDALIKKCEMMKHPFQRLLKGLKKFPKAAGHEIISHTTGQTLSNCCPHSATLCPRSRLLPKQPREIKTWLKT